MLVRFMEWKELGGKMIQEFCIHRWAPKGEAPGASPIF